MQQADCLNCGAPLTGHPKFCPECGQKTDTGRITTSQLFLDFLHSFAHAERGILNLFKGLTINPGIVALEYVRGKRKRYFNPFSFLAICITFLVLMNNWLKPYGELPEPNLTVMGRIPDVATREQYLLTVERNARIQNFANKNQNLGTLLVTPYYALMLWLFFRSRGKNIPEIAVTYLLFTGFTNVVSTILISPFMALTRNTPTNSVLQYFSFFMQTLYFAWGLKVFFGFRSAGGFFRVLGVLALIGIAGFIVILIAMYFYVYRGQASNVLQYL